MINNPIKPRLTYLDNLKALLIILVIVHHVGQAYGPTGGFWLYHSSLHESIPWLKRFFMVNAAFFMGLFFMISGYFIPGSFDRHGGAKFIKDKLIRLGIPIMFMLLVINPILFYFYYIHYSGNIPISYAQYYVTIFLGIGGKPVGFIELLGFPEIRYAFLHLWFVLHLLVYSIIYCIGRSVFKNFTIKESNKNCGFSLLITIAVIIAVASFVVSFWYQHDKWILILYFFPAEVAHLPQYIIMFSTGIIAYRKQWFQKISKKSGYIALILGVIMASLVYSMTYLPQVATVLFYKSRVFYDSFMAVFISWGLLVLFREKFNSAGTLMKWLAENAYAAYIFHFPIVIAVQYSFDKVVIYGALGKFITVSIISIILTYLLCAIIRKIPYVKLCI